MKLILISVYDSDHTHRMSFRAEYAPGVYKFKDYYGYPLAADGFCVKGKYKCENADDAQTAWDELYRTYQDDLAL